MDDESRRNKNGETWKEAKSRYNRKHYQKHKQRIRATQKAREGAAKRAEEDRQAKMQQKRLETLARAREVRSIESKKWNELGHIVGRMSLEAGMSQAKIFKTLQGLATRREIKKWIARAKRIDTLKRKKNSPNSDG